MLCAALSVPVGMSTDGLPVGAQFVAPHGQDGLILSLGLALEKLVGRLEAPPDPPACAGCSASVHFQTVSPATHPASLHFSRCAHGQMLERRTTSGHGSCF